MERRCNKCEWWYGGTDQWPKRNIKFLKIFGTCRIRRPTMGKGLIDGVEGILGNIGIRPIVRKSDRCGEFKEKQDGKKH